MKSSTVHKMHEAQPEVSINGAQLIARQLEQQGTKFIFGIPGAKIDRLFDAIEDTNIQMIPVRHEANGAFMAGVVGRLTGKAGVTMVTSGPGCGNLLSGLATATSEGDPLVAIGGAVKRADKEKLTHQSMDTVNIFRPVTKFSAEIQHVDAAGEVMANAFRAAEYGRAGASFVSLPQDVLGDMTSNEMIVPNHQPVLGAADQDAILDAVKEIDKAKRCVVLLGLQASRPENASAIGRFLDKTQLPVVGTYQAAGAVDISYYNRFGGRIGLFNNQPGDLLLADADLILTIGYSPIEYDPELWNQQHTPVVHLDVMAADFDRCYQPCVEVIGHISRTLDIMTERLGDKSQLSLTASTILGEVAQQRQLITSYASKSYLDGFHPLEVLKAMQAVITPDTTLCLDMGSFHIWIARYLSCFRARQMLISNGQQTMGVALPWGIGASLLNPGQKVISVSGDGGFMQSSMELETAVRLKSNIVHIIWVDNGYNMVAIQELKKYQRHACVDFGPIDFKAYADSFGAKGMAVTEPSMLMPVLREAMEAEGPVVVAIPVDYKDNHKLMAPRKVGSLDSVFS
ncbi:acetolactate synthase AlsS [Vibrio quintilis]|uniref:Acetolactate synthase, catabolic n=1 Tax=Vibrio quintilis TaxID=1117707 RepID=A0A1M7YVX6_9VIBR|nr:acetolactate synthase AlsS [Vibrio quintilis]SHO56751.1 Acetolactate synthase, catabolic [Vibrio quintilis]